MAFVTTNDIDSSASYLGIQRLPGETNADFLNRIKRLSVLRYSTSSDKSVLSICNQIGLDYKEALSIKCSLPFTAKIENNFLILESFTSSGNNFRKIFLGSLHKVGSPATYPLNKLISEISKDPNFTITIHDSSLFTCKRENILSISNFTNERYLISSKYTRINADGIIGDSFYSNSPYVRNRVESALDIKKQGDYYFDSKINYLEIFDIAPQDFYVFYKEYNKIFTVLVSDFNLLSPVTYTNSGLSDNFINILSLNMNGRGIS